MQNHERFIRRCYELARQAVANGNHPFGALLERNGEIILEAENTVYSGHDMTAHAELNLIHAMSGLNLGDSLQGVSLYTSTEPCIMCSGAIYWAGITHVIYGCSEIGLAKYASGDFLSPCRETFAKGTREISVVGPVLQAEGEAIHADYWVG